MASQHPQKLFRNTSPRSTSQGPLRATRPFSLSLRQSPTQLEKGKNRRSPETRVSPQTPERKSPSSPSLKVERSKPLRTTPSPVFRRATPLDTIHYLNGQWPKDNASGNWKCMVDKQTQTPDDWWERSEKKKVNHKRSSSLGTDEKLKELIRQRLQRSKETSKSTSVQQRQSPIHGNHQVISTTTVGTSFAVPAPMTRAQSIPIPVIPRTGTSRLKNSVEGLNQEIAQLVLSGRVHEIGDGDSDVTESFGLTRVIEPTADGRRAPVPRMRSTEISTCNVDTQTPSVEEESLSPVGPPEVHKYDSSPKPNKIFGREPPDGCEKIKIVAEESRRVSPSMVEAYCLVKQGIELKPSQGSAFCPLGKAPYICAEDVANGTTDG